MDRTRILQALRLKGRIATADLPAAAGLDESRCTIAIGQLSADAYAQQAGDRWKLTAGGREHLAHLLAEERKVLDGDRITALYRDFDEHNSALKSLMTRWQLRSEDTPNDHTDAAYDLAVIADLADVDSRFQPLLAQIVQAAPRLDHYPPRLNLALARVQDGDHSWLARPLVDSYHTVWFELHEELIGLAGLSRAEEAAAGRAQ